MGWERYRIWKNDGTYDVAVARNKCEAVTIAIKEKGVDEDDIKSVGKASSRGRLFKYPFEC